MGGERGAERERDREGYRKMDVCTHWYVRMSAVRMSTMSTM